MSCHEVRSAKSEPAISGGRGSLIINADDWGIDRPTTDRALECLQAGTLSSVSAMVFMADSERAAAIAREHAIDAGLHLNLTTPFSFAGVSPALLGHLETISRTLRSRWFAETIFNPQLAPSFEYLVDAQLAEFHRLFGREPGRIDGHHHMHLCFNVLWGRLLPAGTIARRSFSFRRGEKPLLNRLYRHAVVLILRRRHVTTDYLFSLPPLEPVERLRRICFLAREHAVEVEAHPVRPEEYRFLIGGEIRRLAGEVPIARGYVLPAAHR